MMPIRQPESPHLFHAIIPSVNIPVSSPLVTMASASASGPLVFYDIVSGPPVRPYAPNPWKTRYALNFKRADFVTEWVDLTEVESTRKRLGADPVRFFADGAPFYTLPVVEDASAGGAVVGDSFDIAVYLDKKYPEAPPLFRHSIGIYAAFNAHIDSIFPTGGILFTDGQPLNPATAEQTKAACCRRFGAKSWNELTVRGDERRKVVATYQTALGEAAKYFRFSDGPFIGGKEPDYADIIVGGWLMFLSLTVAEWVEIRTWHGGVWGKLHDALEPYRGTW
ncbi:putative glutathione s-transferase [Rosellinia necatrix]|uniref:Putative glutathione s-transferase n=1 Tax=Rosellinia necatrix TaxID=77044 RepID=A0A1W2TBU5_ROSNE|nr:putative glutathione s-transferase [Rosellinia necatrix]